MNAPLRFGVDMGGTKIEVVALDANGNERLRRREATPRNDYPGMLATVQGLVQGMQKELDCKGSVGVGTPGAISPATGLLKNSNTQCLNGKDLRGDLEAQLQCPVRLANDADCFTLSEATDGAAMGAGTVFGVILGTGTGGGIVVNGRLLSGPNAITGEWGHNPLPWPTADELPGPICYCGKRGCIETWLSGPGMSRDHELASGEHRSAEAIGKQAEKGDRWSQTTVKHYLDRLARSLATVINVLDPDVIVLGGGVSGLPAIYTEVPERLGRYVFSDRVDTRLVAARHGDSSGVRGAAWLWPLMAIDGGVSR